MDLKDIDVHFDFTNDLPHYWDNFWLNNNGLGGGNCDPDSASKMLQKYHQLLWSKPLPNGELMTLQTGTGSNYLRWKTFRFGSDSIIVSFRYEKYRDMLEQIENALPDYRVFMENYLHKSNTIGGSIIFPKWRGGINQTRGCNSIIKDRWDLTLECIRRYYKGEKSPLYDTLCKDKEFFDLFIDFQGFVDFFFLQDCVSKDYTAIKFWIDKEPFDPNPLPRTVNDYLQWIEYQLDFVEKRNIRIKNWISEQ